MTTPTKNPGLMKKSRDQNLDATRGIAAIMIFLYHISIFEWTRFLWIYVNLFFLLSGYVLYDQIISIKKIKEFKIFLKARFMRIFPLFIFILFFRIILDIINRVNNQLPVSSFFEIFENKDIFYAILLLQNFSQKSTMLFFPAWSLSSEWITYLVISIVFLLLSFRVIPMAILVGILMIFSGYQIDLDYVTQYGFNYGIGAIGQGILGFGIGMLIKKNQAFLKKYGLRHKLIKILVLNIILVILVSKLTYTPILILLTYFIFSLTLISIVELNQNPRLHIIKKSLGQLSYGIYLWHTVVISVYNNLLPQIDKVTLFVISMFSTIVCASSTYLLVEKPFLKLSRYYSSKLKL